MGVPKTPKAKTPGPSKTPGPAGGIPRGSPTPMSTSGAAVAATVQQRTVERMETDFQHFLALIRGAVGVEAVDDDHAVLLDRLREVIAMGRINGCGEVDAGVRTPANPSWLTTRRDAGSRSAPQTPRAPPRPSSPCYSDAS